MLSVNLYPQWLLVNFLHVAYLERVNHPLFRCLMADHRIVYEAAGEASFSSLARVVAVDPNRQEYEHIQRAYRRIGAFRDISRAYDTEAGKGKVGAGNKGIDLEVKHADIINDLEVHLTSVMDSLNTEGTYPRYVPGKGSKLCTDLLIKPKAPVTRARAAPVYYGEHNYRSILSYGAEMSHVRALYKNDFHRKYDLHLL